MKCISLNQCTRLEQLPNVGPAIAADLRRIGILRPGDLKRRDPYAMYEKLCQVTRKRQDPCVLDVFISAVRFMGGAPARPWWAYTAQRKRELQNSAAKTRKMKLDPSFLNASCSIPYRP
ncbi:MAG: helix-hairpin-helix domain-containing protein [Pirellulales bacterium]|nr:helix-hairpin-helix domain-containing protein [Pirellulales bacterium]